jgi:hypothetical protein
MAEARVKDEWRRTSTVLALIANCNRDPRKTKAFRPVDFDPIREPQKAIRADITVLKDVFIDRQMPGYGGSGEFE